jgi:RNA polymerase sigma-70 factor, ECF subfamily
VSPSASPPDDRAPDEVTRLLHAIAAGVDGAADALAPIVYDELHQLASALMRRERGDHTLQPTALVHDAFLRLVDQRDISWQSRKHFYGLAATAMRRLLVDHARRRAADKRDGGQRITLDDVALTTTGRPLELLALDDALERLTVAHDRAARLVELRFFTGLEIDEAADVLGVGRATAVRDWTFARAFLQRALAE